MTRRNLLIMTVAALMLPAFGANKPSLTGEWKLNADKSNFGPMPPPEAMTQKVDHDDPALKIITMQKSMEGDATWTINLTTDGQECKNDIRGASMVSKATWEGDVLIVTSKLDFQGMEITIKQKMKLSEDGKTLTSASNISTPQGEFEQTLVMDKMEPAAK
jgi:hypothetical protein